MLYDVLIQFSLIALIGVGMTWVIVIRSIDLSVGSQVALTSVLYGSVLASSGSVLVAFAATMFAGAVTGGFNGALVGWLRIPSFVATLATLGIYRGFALMTTNGQSVRVGTQSSQSIGDLIPIDPGVLFVFCVVPIGWMLLHRTMIGLRAFAYGGNPNAAELVGIRSKMQVLWAFGSTGLCCALAGIALAERLGAARPTAGVGYELEVIAAVVLGGTSLFGGTGGILRTVAAALVIAMSRYLMTLNGITPYAQQVVLGLVLIVAVLVLQYRRLRDMS